MAFAAAAVAETPLPVQHVGRDDRDNAGNYFGGYRLGLKNRELQRVENCRVDNECGAADDGKFDQLMVAHRKGLNDPGKARNCGIGKGHSTPVYG